MQKVALLFLVINMINESEELEKSEEIATKGAILKSKTRWSEAGEKNTKYFLNLEKRNAVDKHICQLQLLSGEITSTPKGILTELKRYHQTLYSNESQSDSSNHAMITDIFTDELNTLSQDEMKSCEGLVREQ